MHWKKGQLVWIEADTELGPARIIDDSREDAFLVASLRSGEKRFYTKRRPPFRRLHLFRGQRLRIEGHSEDVLVTDFELREDLYDFATLRGRFRETQITNVLGSQDVLGLLRQKKFTAAKAFALRGEARALLANRERYAFRGAAGCRVEILPHQVSVLEAALRMPHIRALLADEVGLGKTVEAGLIVSALAARGDLRRVLVLVPPALKVQWLTELAKRFHVPFRLDHEDLIEEGDHRDFVISSLEELDRNFTELDLLIVDEAHGLLHDESHAESLAGLVERARHVLFLSATPRVHGDEEFFRLLDTLCVHGERELEPLVFRSEREALGIPTYRQLEAAFVEDKEAWLLDFLGARVQGGSDEKVFLITASADDVKKLGRDLAKRFGERFAVFHEGMDLVERDRQAAYFADPDGAQFLLSSEIGGEGRNFQFCRHMVFLDLPADPLVVEQRIGRLDRIGQKRTVHVWCPVLVHSAEEEVFEDLRDHYHVFEKPWAGAGLGDLPAERLDQTVENRDLASLQEEGGFRLWPYRKEHAEELGHSLEDFATTPIEDFTERLYDLFGIEVEEIDRRGNLRIAASTLMFVESFPGLGAEGERLLTFEREQALAREDLEFFSIDHPDFVDSVKFFLASDLGRLSVAELPKGVAPDIVLCGLRLAEGSGQPETVLWSVAKRKAVSLELNFAELRNVAHLPEAFLQALPEAMNAFNEAHGFEGWEAILLLVPKASFSV